MRNDLSELSVFAKVAEERSFTRAAAHLGISQSALSHSMRGLEKRLGLQLLARTTRSVSPHSRGHRASPGTHPRPGANRASTRRDTEAAGDAIRSNPPHHPANSNADGDSPKARPVHPAPIRRSCWRSPLPTIPSTSWLESTTQVSNSGSSSRGI